MRDLPPGRLQRIHIGTIPFLPRKGPRKRRWVGSGVFRVWFAIGRGQVSADSHWDQSFLAAEGPAKKASGRLWGVSRLVRDWPRAGFSGFTLGTFVFGSGRAREKGVGQDPGCFALGARLAAGRLQRIHIGPSLFWQRKGPRKRCWLGSGVFRAGCPIGRGPASADSLKVLGRIWGVSPLVPDWPRASTSGFALG